MKKMDCVTISEANISGINNPLLVIKGYIFDEKTQIILLIDNKEVTIDSCLSKKKNYFTIMTPISKKAKLIELYALNNRKKYLIYKMNNKLIKRMIYKLKKNIVNIFKKLQKAIYVIGKGISYIWKKHHFLVPPRYWKKYLKKFAKKIKGDSSNLYYNPYNKKDYNKWFKENYVIEDYKKLKYEPLISIVIPVYNIERKFLVDCLDSILQQNYENYEVCLADDNSTSAETIDTLKEYEKKDKRIRVVYRKKNGHISKATNSAIKIARGEYIALMDDDDVITKDALYQFVKLLNEHPNADLVYSDEDKMEMDGTLCDPHFKPDYAPDTLYGGNYICHFSIYRKKIIDEIGGFRDDFVGAQDYDLVLRFVEKTKNIYHISKILYHWRKVPGSTAVTIDNKEYAIENGRRAVEESLERRGLKGNVTVPIKSAHYIVEYDVIGNPLVSIIVPTKDCSEMLNKCLKSIYEKSTYKNYEIIVVNNKSKDKNTLKLFEQYKKKHDNFKVMDASYEFNYSKMNNDAVQVAKGEYVLLLNNDTEVITNNWIELMLGYAMQNHVGAVGAKLLYPDLTVQHGGIVLGVGGIAANVFSNVDSENYGVFGRLLIPYDYSAVTAACLMVKKDKYLSVNGLDESLKVAYNDVDFNMKLLSQGYYNVFLPNVNLFHYESKSRGMDTTIEKKRRLQEERKIMIDKWGKKLKNDKFYNKNYSLNWWFLLDKEQK